MSKNLTDALEQKQENISIPNPKATSVNIEQPESSKLQ
jgi:hypothetical protein